LTKVKNRSLIANGDCRDHEFLPLASWLRVLLAALPFVWAPYGRVWHVFSLILIMMVLLTAVNIFPIAPCF
jgi:hypothetical protein